MEQATGGATATWFVLMMDVMWASLTLMGWSGDPSSVTLEILRSNIMGYLQNLRWVSFSRRYVETPPT